MLLLRQRRSSVLVLLVTGLTAASALAGPSSPPASRPSAGPASRPSPPASRPAGIRPTRLRIKFQNHMGPLYRLVSLVVLLDGMYIYKRSDDTGMLDRTGDLLIYDGAVAPASHTVSVKLVYRGAAMGLFAYRRQYIYTLRSSHTLPAAYGRRTTVLVRGYRRGNIFWRPENRMMVGFVVQGQTAAPARRKRATSRTKKPPVR